MARASALAALAAVTLIAADCAIDPFCTEGTSGCAADPCQNQLRDGDESDVDCGGACAPCAGGAACRSADDCASARCFDGACCEPPCPVWSRRLGGAAEDLARSAVELPNGTVVVAGEMRETLDLGAGPLVSAGGADLFVAAFAPGGSLKWARRIGGAGNDFAPHLAVGPDGRLWLGALSGSDEIDTGAGVLQSDGGFQQIVVIELDADGASIQARTFGNQGITTYFADLAATADGGVVLLGGLGRIDFGDGTVLVSTDGPLAGGPLDVFVARLDAGLQRVWHRQIGDGQNDYAYGIALDAEGDVVVGVDTTSSTDLGGDPVAGPGVMLARYRGADGAHLWSRSYGVGVFATALSRDPGGDLLVAGDLGGEADLGTGKLFPRGTADAFVARFDAAGVPRWAVPVPGSVGSHAVALTRHPGGAIVALQLTGTLDLEGGVSAPVGVDSLALVQLDAGGRFVWARNEGGVLIGSPVGLLPLASGNVLAYGGYSGTLALGGIGASAGQMDAFVAELLP